MLTNRHSDQNSAPLNSTKYNKIKNTVDESMLRKCSLIVMMIIHGLGENDKDVFMARCVLGKSGIVADDGSGIEIGCRGD